MEQVTISKEEYTILLAAKRKYDYLQQFIKEDLFASPPTKNIDEVVAAFSQSGKYSEAFIESLKKGLERSTYFKKK